MSCARVSIEADQPDRGHRLASQNAKAVTLVTPLSRLGRSEIRQGRLEGFVGYWRVGGKSVELSYTDFGQVAGDGLGTWGAR